VIMDRGNVRSVELIVILAIRDGMSTSMAFNLIPIPNGAR
jgi:hypothetical protein